MRTMVALHNDEIVSVPGIDVVFIGVNDLAFSMGLRGRQDAPELKAAVAEKIRGHRPLTPMQVHVLSFGFKYGPAVEADLLVDVRFLRNPYFVPELKPLDGEHPAIRQYVLDTPEARALIAKYTDLVDYLKHNGDLLLPVVGSSLLVAVFMASISMAIAVASPPPMQSAAMPRLAFCASSACNSVTISRAPVAPMG